jgi:hypothetical protein
MAKEIGERFAKIVLSELADMHALLLCMADQQILEAATHPESVVIEQSKQTMHQLYEAKRAERADEIYNSLLLKLDLKE